MWQLLMEAGALAASAGAAGVLAAYAGVRAILWLAPPDLPRIDEIRLDGAVLAFAVGLTTVTALVFGLWPAWRLSRVNLQEALRESGRGMSSSHAAARTRSILLVVQCALAIMLLAGAGLLLRSLGALHGMDTGFRTANLLTMRVNASRTTYAQQPQLRQFYDQVLQRVQALPGVKSAAIATDLFLSNTPSSGPSRSRIVRLSRHPSRLKPQPTPSRRGSSRRCRCASSAAGFPTHRTGTEECAAWRSTKRSRSGTGRTRIRSASTWSSAPRVSAIRG